MADDIEMMEIADHRRGGKSGGGGGAAEGGTGGDEGGVRRGGGGLVCAWAAVGEEVLASAEEDTTLELASSTKEGDASGDELDASETPKKRKRWIRRRLTKEMREERRAALALLLDSVDFSTPHKRTFGTHRGLTFIYLVDDGVCFVLAVQGDISLRVCFAFLESVRLEYVDGAPAHQRKVGKWLSPIMVRELDYWNENPTADKLTHMKAEVEEVKGIMIENMNELLARGHALEALQAKTEALEGNAENLYDHSKKLKCAKCKSNYCCCCCFCCT
mmetsp:Transcript_24280/g.60833  ORF Transcript_24280/g.60833 Transcript_24280/m.60833 type:complete len:275 (+) Transcript_24280:97-921(+)